VPGLRSRRLAASSAPRYDFNKPHENARPRAHLRIDLDAMTVRINRELTEA
jgi:hypothetical protein